MLINENYFETILRRDKFSENGSYKVRSLYFDTIDDNDFFDKVNEQNFRRKIRLRIYTPQDKFVKLELKQKENIYQKKRSLIISRADALALINCNYSVLLNYNDDFAAELYGIMMTQCYRPKTIIEHNRSAFMAKENNIRLTFDSEIMATEGSFDLFSENLMLYPILDKSNVIFEVKYNKFMLSYISDIINRIDKRKVSSSKYCLGRSISYRGY